MGGKVQRYAEMASCALFLVITACSTKATAPQTCEPYTPDADLSATVSFSASVIPIFQKNCASIGGTCHGDQGKSPRLGSADDGGIDAAIVLESIVGMVSAEDPTMAFVTPSDPAHSFLMHKIDADQCTLSAECEESLFSDDFPNCGSPMPFLRPTLPETTRNEVRAWIQQGAQQN
jgi:hypothetical protein